MPSPRHRAAHRAVRPRRRVGAVVLPALGVVTLAGTGVAVTGMTNDPPAAVETTALRSLDRPGVVRSDVADLRDGAAERSSRSAQRPSGSAPEPTPTPTTEPAPEPTAEPAPEPTPDPVPRTAEGFPVVEGCSETAPDLDGVANGRLSSDQLCPIGDGHLLRSDAAAAFLAMERRYRDETGEGICLTDSYRDYDSQVSVAARKPGLAAAPGTSNHGWGQALDLSCGAESFSSGVHAWLVEQGPEFGWTNPSWAQAGGSRPEPWHWEFDPDLIG